MGTLEIVLIATSCFLALALLVAIVALSKKKGDGSYGKLKDDLDKNMKEVKCNNGTFIGKETGDLIIWKGIPYATQPVGKLRWKKALPTEDNNGVFDATKPGHIPIGIANDSGGTA